MSIRRSRAPFWMRRAVEGGRGRLPSSGGSGAGAAHGGDLLVEVSAMFEVLLDVVSAIPVPHLHGPASLADVVLVGVIVACGGKISGAQLKRQCVYFRPTL